MQSKNETDITFQMKVYMYKNHWRYFQRPKVVAYARHCSHTALRWLSPAIHCVTPVLQKLNFQLPQMRTSGPWWMALVFVVTASVTGAPTNALAAEMAWMQTQGGTYSAGSVQSLHTGNYTMPSLDRDNIYKPRMIYPVGNVTISSTFGWREAPCATCSSDHEGLDMNPGAGAPIYAAMSGTVLSFGWDGSLGYDIVISDDHGWTLYYGHMVEGSVPSGIAVGSKVRMGDLIGNVGCTGSCTGAHLHFAIKDGDRFIDPLPELQQYAE